MPDERVHAEFDVWQFGDARIFRARNSGIQLIRTPKQVRSSPAPTLAVAAQQAGDGHYEQAASSASCGRANYMYDFSRRGDGCRPACTCRSINSACPQT